MKHEPEKWNEQGEAERSENTRPVTVAEAEWRAQKICLTQIGYTSEWAIKKFFPALFKQEYGNQEYGLADKFVLKAIAGGERNQTEARRRMIKEAEQRLGRVKQQNSSGKKELNDIITMLTLAMLTLADKDEDDITYFPLDRIGNALPNDIYTPGFCDAAIIHSANPSHLNYIRYAIRHGLHVLCEKPLVPVIDSQGLATRDDLDELIEINRKRIKKNSEGRGEHCERGYVVAMDAEHYSAKQAARIFFEHAGRLIAEHGMITGVEGSIMEIDDPEKERTHSVLSLENRTGLLADTGIHLMNIVASLGGVFDQWCSALYAVYPGYDVETYARIAYKVKDNQKGVFDGTVPVRFSVAKFVDRLDVPLPEAKRITFAFQDEQIITVDFREGVVRDKRYRELGSSFCVAHPKNEYASVLLDFYDAIKEGKEPRTSFEASINALDALYRIYEAFPVKENCTEVYQQQQQCLPAIRM